MKIQLSDISKRVYPGNSTGSLKARERLEEQIWNYAEHTHGKVPTKYDTIEDMKVYLDENGIDYKGVRLKDDFLELCHMVS